MKQIKEVNKIRKEEKLMKKSLIVIALALTFLFGITSGSQAVTIGFEELTLGSSHASLVYADVTFTNNMGSLNVASSPGAPLSGNVILGPNTHTTGEWYVATFGISSVNNVSVDLGDWDADYDTLKLYAFDSFNNLIGVDSDLNPYSTYGGLTLSVTTLTNIAYVWFNETGNNDFATGYPGSIYFDNFTYNTVPEPSTLLLLGSGLIGLAAFGRKRLQY